MLSNATVDAGATNVWGKNTPFPNITSTGDRQTEKDRQRVSLNKEI